MASSVRLPGLEHDSLLAFMALMGAVALFDGARPGWRPRASWQGRHPALHLDADVGRGGLAAALAEGLGAFGIRAASMPDGGPKVPAGEFGRLQRAMDPAIASALGSDGAVDGDGNAQHTPLCMMFGAGHQRFFVALRGALCAGGAGAEGELGRSLFGARGRRPEGGAGRPTFRWDPDEYRPHAHRGRDPGRDRPAAPAGANRLAAAGFVVFDCAPTAHGLCTASYVDGNGARCAGPPGAAGDGKEYALWPVWDPPLPLAAVRALLHYPYVPRILRGGAGLLRDLRAYGVDRVMRAEVFRDGRFRNVRLAAPVV